MNKRPRTIIVLVCLLDFSVDVNAQLNTQKYELGAAIGGFVYQGDLTPYANGSHNTSSVGVQLHGSKILSPSFLARTTFSLGRLRGDDADYDQPEYRQHRNFNFHTSLVELTPQIVWNPLGKNYDDRGLMPYFFGGIGLSFVKIKRDWSHFDAAYFGESSDLPDRIAADAAHKPPRIIPVIPVGLGLRYNISSRLAIQAETSYRFTNTDYLDGFSKAVNPAKADQYYSATAGVVYRIGKKNLLDCPVIKY